MKHFQFLKIGFFILFLAAPLVHAETPPKKEKLPQRHVKLEDMSAAEFKEALKKSHAESVSRFGDGGSIQENDSDGYADEDSDSSEKQAYENSAQNKIDRLDNKISSLESRTNNLGYAQKDAAKLKDIQMRARQELTKLRTNRTDSWKTNKAAMESLFRQADTY